MTILNLTADFVWAEDSLLYYTNVVKFVSHTSSIPVCNCFRLRQWNWSFLKSIWYEEAHGSEQSVTDSSPVLPDILSVLFTSLVRYQFALVIYLLVLQADL